ncbi:uncharacterized protein LAESUDRAFT_413470 [Laetiporus sulphureus 93-53]|uniref:C3H1-type domain-containing protein n=1 Tax=Laetiporus sulphureus 93-53 TaxID=1314785 RepID=A0A165C7P1_9APHY|nr:uncharacterized protein LAESUDRAFT_413470 [Laetiporus sulphureus 93-53]KZT02343.1 hypothetical protein LAESUDRAFT_413470 [Laetiporus sulphureus 93-53]
MTVPDPPWKQKTRPCPFYSQGRCLFADSCNFLHTAKAHPSEGVIVAATESPLPSPPPTPILRKRRQGMTPKLQDGDEEFIEDSESDDEDLLTAIVQTVTGSAILVEEPGELVSSEVARTHGSRSGSLASLGDATVMQRSIPLAEEPAVLKGASVTTIAPHVADSRDFASASIGSAYSKENGRRSSIFVHLTKRDASTEYEGSSSANQNALDDEAAGLVGESTVIQKPVPVIDESAGSSDSIEFRSSFHQDGLIQATASPRVDTPRKDHRFTGSQASSVGQCNADIGVATPRLSCILALGGTRASVTAASVKSEANLKANPDGGSIKQSHDYEESLPLPSGLLSPIEITATPPIELPPAASSASYMHEQRESVQSTFPVGSDNEDERIMPSTFRTSPPRSPRRVSMLSTLSSRSGSTTDRISPSMGLRSSLSRPTLTSRSERSVIADEISPSQFQDADSLSGRRSSASRDSMALASPVLNESEAEYTSADWSLSPPTRTGMFAKVLFAGLSSMLRC